MNIEFNVLDRQYKRHRSEYNAAVLRVLESGLYILGNELDQFEREFAQWEGSDYCVGLNSGLDALSLAVRALGIGEGDEVIVPANTYIATIMGVTINNAKPIFVEANEFYNIDPGKIETVINEKTKAILVVHLYGQIADMKNLTGIARKYGLYLIEDCAQAHGAMFEGKKAGTFGTIGCFSFFPTKNMGAFGDGGAIVTNEEPLADKVRTLRNYGSKVKYHNEYVGLNSRLDEVQASLLRIKLKYIRELTNERREIAGEYLSRIKNKKIKLPSVKYGLEGHVFHLFVVQTEHRDLFQNYLLDHGIKTQVHYPIPPHLAECYRYLDYKRGDLITTERQAETIISLPLFNGMTKEEIDYVITVINEY